MSKLRRQLETHMVLRDFSPRTRKVYLVAVDKFEAYFGKPVHKLGERQIQEYLRYLIHDRGLSQSYVSQSYSALKLLYETCLGRPWNIDRIPRSKKRKRLPVVLSQTEIQAVLEASPNLKYRTLFATAYSAGLRTGEVSRLTLPDIDSEHMRIRVDQGKGGKDRFSILAHETLLLLREYWKAHRPPRWLFTPERNLEAPLSTRAIQRAFQITIARTSIQKQASVRSLRHSFATHLLDEGVDLFFIKQLLGHANINTTTVYLHLSGKQLSQVQSPIDRWGQEGRQSK